MYIYVLTLGCPSKLAEKQNVYNYKFYNNSKPLITYSCVSINIFYCVQNHRAVNVLTSRRIPINHRTQLYVHVPY